MPTFSQFKKGDVLFRQGDASDHVLQIRSGEIEVLREVGEASVLLGEVREGEWLGEMGVIENRNRSATARAAADGAAEVFTAGQFLDRVTCDPALARGVILRLSIRLRKLEDKVAEDLLPSFREHVFDGPERMASEAVIPENVTVSIVAQTDILRARIGAAPIQVVDLPYVVGRLPIPGEAEPARHPNLLIEDEAPFRLSRDHFMITRRQNGLLILDLGSTLGTMVNGQSIGHHFMKDEAPLRPGENRIVAGGRGSRFEFTVSVGL
jgi:CRP/FNR family cyclic AMP-dependent transcriptional regulator